MNEKSWEEEKEERNKGLENAPVDSVEKNKSHH
jgi:hypothetical protein